MLTVVYIEDKGPANVSKNIFNLTLSEHLVMAMTFNNSAGRITSNLYSLKRRQVSAAKRQPRPRTTTRDDKRFCSGFHLYLRQLIDQLTTTNDNQLRDSWQHGNRKLIMNEQNSKGPPPVHCDVGIWLRRTSTYARFVEG